MNVKPTNEFFEEHGIVAIRADKGVVRTSEQIDNLLIQLGNKTKAIPFYALYPPGGGEPQILDGLITSDKVISIFKEFGVKPVEKEAAEGAGKEKVAIND